MAPKRRARPVPCASCRVPDTHVSSGAGTGPDLRDVTRQNQAHSREGSITEAAIILHTLTGRPYPNLDADQSPVSFESPVSPGSQIQSDTHQEQPLNAGIHPSTGTQAQCYSLEDEQDSHLSTIFSPPGRAEFSFSNFLPITASETHGYGEVNYPHWSTYNNKSQTVPNNNGSTLGLQEACLVRCFVQHLADAFDTTDQYRAYKTIVPEEAKKRPLLLNAICTAASGYLTIVQSAQDPDGIVHYNGIPLPNLRKESTIKYHNSCISYMIDCLNNPQDPFDDVLIAIPLLRYHEQIDTQLTGSDSETYSNALGSIFRAKQPSFTSLLSAIGNTNGTMKLPLSREFTLRRSACLIALKQEITSVLCYRRPFQISLPAHYYNGLALSQKDQYDDYDWTNHILIWCAYVLKYYYGSESDTDIAEDAQTRTDQLQSLKAFEEQWKLLDPNPLDPFFYQERDPDRGQFFPIVWQGYDHKVIGMQHLEFGRMVLAAHDRRTLGLGAAAATRAMEEQLRQSTRIICGLALSHRIQPAMTGASTAISLCGECFHDPREQAAIGDLMATIEREYAWSTSSVMDSLYKSWNSL
ncbi:hypothetical protein NPX13_g9402 [Xylaria arbuscula]|uniref:Transcription factor domain-containing protein n=1 Tax=Xylaria arbuscula TaxID=114810 RepID=A0A9W8N6K9_9PEZI|nr:hypothetical protein NPX13_g9402 [Xylaria arbuscula]